MGTRDALGTYGTLRDKVLRAETAARVAEEELARAVIQEARAEARNEDMDEMVRTSRAFQAAFHAYVLALRAEKQAKDEANDALNIQQRAAQEGGSP